MNKFAKIINNDFLIKSLGYRWHRLPFFDFLIQWLFLSSTFINCQKMKILHTEKSLN